MAQSAQDATQAAAMQAVAMDPSAVPQSGSPQTAVQGASSSNSFAIQGAPFHAGAVVGPSQGAPFQHAAGPSPVGPPQAVAPFSSPVLLDSKLPLLLPLCRLPALSCRCLQWDL